jgi:hypothetical protein
MTMSKQDDRGNQGEGDKEADRRYRERTEKFLKSPHGQEEIKHAGDVSDKERAELEKAEEQGRKRAKERDPQETLDPRQPH